MTATHMPDGFSSDSKTFFKSLKIYRLAKLLILHMQSKIREIKAAGQGNKISAISPKNEQLNAPVFVRSAPNNSFKIVDVKEEERRDDNFYNNLGKQLTAKRDISSARQAFEKAIALNSYNVDAYFRLASLSDPDKCHSIMREIFEKYRDLIINSKIHGEQNGDLGHLCRVLVGKGMYSEAEELCKEMLAKNLMCKDAYIILARSYLEQNQYTEAEDYYKRIIELDNRESQAFDGLAVVYHETGKNDLSEEYLRKANELRPCYLSMAAILNYKKIKEILDKNKIKLVCVQYPMRNVEPLKSIFEGEENIVFVDNEKIFKEAVDKLTYKYFLGICGRVISGTAQIKAICF